MVNYFCRIRKIIQYISEGPGLNEQFIPNWESRPINALTNNEE